MKASVIIVNYNGRSFLRECIDSLMKQTFTDFEIIFVDNNSSDGSYEFMKENYNSENISLIRSEINLGFAGGNNLGFRHCKGELIVLLNNDTVTDKNWLKGLVECIESDEKTGIVQSLVITRGIPMKYYEKNGTVNLLGHNIMSVFEIDKNGRGEIFQANGCSLMIRKILADELGGLFPDEYFAYSEDTYLCLKAKFYGSKIMHTSASIVDHFGGGASGNKDPSFMFFYQERNRLMNFLLFFSGKFIVKYIPVLILNFFLKSAASVVSKKYSFSKLVKAYFWLMKNQHLIRERRKSLDKIKRVNENEVLKYISGKLFNGDNVFERGI
ncbi:MAG: glycosyltransferase family 2 protein [Ignavibacteria bacterium]|nr:glycosyltransferase family 2 protein [Ignavibacteria bacterium]